MQQGTPKTISIFLTRHHIGITLFNPDTYRIQCSQFQGPCSHVYQIVKDSMIGCRTIVSNHFGHQIFGNMEISQYNIVPVQDKNLQYQTIEHDLESISQHMRQWSNPKAYIKQMSRFLPKFKSLGMLLSHILPVTSSKLYIQDIDYFIDTLYNNLTYTPQTLNFLQITREDLHPSHIKRHDNNKEGYSIISAYQAFMVSNASKKILKFLLFNPSYDLKVIRQRQGVIQWMGKWLKEGKYAKCFREMGGLESLINKVGKMSVEETQWKKIMKTIQAMIQMRKILLLNQNPPSLISKYINSPHWQDIIQLFQILSDTLDPSTHNIKKGIDSTLDDLKKTYDTMPHLLTLIARDQGWQFDFKIIFMAQVGYLIKIKKDTELPVLGEEWVLQFVNKEHLFYSNGVTVKLDQQYGDIYGQIQDIEKKIIFQLQTLILQRQTPLLQLYWCLSEIQCFWGISQLSKNMCIPKLSSQALIISNGWHLLLTGNIIHNHGFSFPQNQAPRSSVQNKAQNLVNSNYSNRCSIITGPNASGKTVYMKQIGLLIYLAHCGFLLPATIAEIPLVDSIHFVGTSQSIYQNQTCGFEEELRSLSSIAMCNVVSSKAFIMIDEMGAYIDYDNTLKILYNTIDFLTTQNNPNFLHNRLLSKPTDEFSTPLLFIITHLSQILSTNTLQENYLIRFLTMLVEDQGLRLFKIRPGLVKKGYGIKSAAEYLDDDTIKMSQSFYKMISRL